MSKAPHGRAVFLIGFMGAGKTAVGGALAQKLGWNFIDLDERIEQQAKHTIAEIFETLGEPVFRRIENEQLSRLLERDLTKSAVVALGGGAFAQPAIAEKLREAKVPVIFLDAPLRRRAATKASAPGPRV
jgi:shikimate kinase